MAAPQRVVVPVPPAVPVVYSVLRRKQAVTEIPPELRA